MRSAAFDLQLQPAKGQPGIVAATGFLEDSWFHRQGWSLAKRGKGKANKAVKELLAKRLGIGKGAVEIISGQRSRQKRVRIHGFSREDLDRFLSG